MARSTSKTPALPAVAPPLQPGDLVGSYRITATIGEGGMGAVYEAEHIHLATRAAIKVLLPELSVNPEAIKRFVNEARAASALKHPRIVTVHECAQRPNGQWFIVLEFVEGGSLKRKMRSLGPLGVVDVVSIVAQTASALDAAHRARIIHRDIKPENILLTPSATNPNDDDVTVVDFGIAKIDESRGGVGTRQGVALGTPNYMAPEYLRGDPIDHRVDVYALGVVTWEMLTGESLWGEGDQPPTKIHEQQRTGARPLDPRVIKSHIPPELGVAVASALAFDPAARWPNVRAFALAVAHAVTSEWGETGMDTLRRVARELAIAPGDDPTAGRPMPPPLAPTMPIAAPVTAPQPSPGAVPIVVGPDAVPTRPNVPAHAVTPAPAQPGRANAPTLDRGTVSLAVSVSQAPIVVGEPSRAPRSRRTLVAALAAAIAIAAVVAGVLAASGGNGSATQAAATTPPPAPATSAIAIVSEPSGAAIIVDGTPRGFAPVNVAAAVGAEIEIRAELDGHTPAVERARIGAEPATVRVVLAAIVAAPPIDAAAAVPAPTIDAGTRRKRPRLTTPAGGSIDPDGLVQP